MDLYSASKKSNCELIGQTWIKNKQSLYLKIFDYRKHFYDTLIKISFDQKRPKFLDQEIQISK